MELEIKITGGGTALEIAEALKQVAFDLEAGNHINGINTRGECEWEDATLMTNISEV